MTKFTRPFAVLAALAMSTAAQSATITPIQPSPHEPDLVEILDSIYGAGNYFRIDDDSDQTWAAGQITATALSTYSAATENLGVCVVCDGSDDVFFDQVVTTDGIFSMGLTVGGLPIPTFSSPFTWFNLAANHPAVGKVYSDPTLNPLGGDHMVTFGIAGQPDTYILAFEDWLFSSTPASDRDYQDVIFQINYVGAPPNTTVPEPGALITMAGGLAALFYFRSRKTRAN